MRIEKLTDPNIDPVGAAEQTREPWCSVATGAWVVIGTDSVDEARAFYAEAVSAFIG